MYQVTNPKTGKKYTYSTARQADAEGLAKKLGVEVVEVIAVGSLPNRKKAEKNLSVGLDKVQEGC
jgi:hypothetical protein